ncbi:hypothetical protein [Amycolatopsis sp. EV170708-02-1]|uniref:hypothetical protein n=1 Tax=Amycolatopsis sp. EV170708-02-1 TaxID=2919322 RepID=UPI001F0BACD5|nr:hypothetical protein [Amycolatopsis sp. EV170708-02-1]UMO99896.1 hypothetical protein MJQ72_25645 [Amycolatopsis sp. EV170708-02-1]
MKKWTTRVTTGLLVAGMALAVQSAPAMAEEEADSTTTEVALTDVTTEGIDASGDCGGWRGGLAGYKDWKVDKAGCGYISPDSKKNPQHRRYTWKLPPGSNSRICVQAEGHYWSTKKNKSVKTWKTAGCGTGGTVVVRWSGPPKKGGGYLGLASTPRVRAKVQPGFGGVAYSWK